MLHETPNCDETLSWALAITICHKSHNNIEIEGELPLTLEAFKAVGNTHSGFLKEQAVRRTTSLYSIHNCLDTNHPCVSM